MPRRTQVVVRRPFTDDGDYIIFDLEAAHWAGTDDGGQSVWVSPSLSQEAKGYSGGVVEDNGATLTLRGGL